MSRDRIRPSEFLHGVDYWIGVIDSRWERIPEYEVDPEKLRHMAVICDGNRRSAIEKGLNPWDGHRIGVEVIKGVMRASRDWGIKYLTFWTWSTENWKRDKEQVEFVMGLAAKHLREDETLRTLVENEVRFNHIGRKDRLPWDIQDAIKELEERTRGFNRFYINLALDYGGLDEITRAVRNIASDVERGLITSLQLDEYPELLLSYLDTASQPFPDLVIRTGFRKGEVPHTSGFMPVQTAYSGWMFVPELFPDLSPESILKPIKDFSDYDRRFGR